MSVPIYKKLDAKIDLKQLRYAVAAADHGSFRRAAEALNCTLVYAIVPNDSLETIVQSRIRDLARRQLKAVDHTMRLEHQSVSPDDIEKQIDLFAKQIPLRTLWDD